MDNILPIGQGQSRLHEKVEELKRENEALKLACDQFLSKIANMEQAGSEHGIFREIRKERDRLRSQLFSTKVALKKRIEKSNEQAKQIQKLQRKLQEIELSAEAILKRTKDRGDKQTARRLSRTAEPL